MYYFLPKAALPCFFRASASSIWASVGAIVIAMICVVLLMNAGCYTGRLSEEAEMKR